MDNTPECMERTWTLFTQRFAHNLGQTPFRSIHPSMVFHLCGTMSWSPHHHILDHSGGSEGISKPGGANSLSSGFWVGPGFPSSRMCAKIIQRSSPKKHSD
ncbi:hypothetical protein XENOCAPTIV_027202 [Xenoophorus captivus]|uniref:Uncharacterized protein n=2 Tax=Goodeidae TaxID=28758 RepID=A0ABV0SH41_9TELE